MVVLGGGAGSYERGTPVQVFDVDLLAINDMKAGNRFSGAN